MGYRSMVGIRCKEKVYDEINKLDGLIAPDSIYVNKEYNEYTLIWDWVKWYDEDFPELIAFRQLLKNIDKEHLDESEWEYKFIRVGEGIDTCCDDIEEVSNGYMEFFINVSFDIRKTDSKLQ